MGKRAGTEFEIDVAFPEDYHAENLKGKDAKFQIKVNKVESRELPEVNDEFVAKFGVAEGGIDALKAEVRKNMERELAQAVKNKIKEQAIDGLVKRTQSTYRQRLLIKKLVFYVSKLLNVLVVTQKLQSNFLVNCLKSKHAVA